MSKTDGWIASVIAIGLFVYVVVRAVLIPITYDEAATFFHYVNQGLFWPGTAHWDANNHILNSFLSIQSFQLFGSSEFALRLPNVLSAIIYFVFAIKLSQLAENRIVGWLLFAALAFNQFVLEFLAISRGYGISMSLLLPALYFAYRWMKNKQVLSLVLSLVFVQLATLANLSLLLLNLSVTGVLVLWFLVQIRDKWFLNSAAFLMSFAAIAWFVRLSFEYKSRGLFYYGSGDGFWNVTVLSLAKYGFVGLTSIFPFVSVMVLLFLLLFSALILKKNGIQRSLLFPTMLFLCMLGNWLMNLLLGVNYPEDRVAIFYLILGPIALAFLVDKVVHETKAHALKKGVLRAAFLLLTFPVNFALSANVSHVYLWKEDACAKSFYHYVLSYASATKTNPTVAGYRLRDLPFFYYNFRNGGQLSPIQDNAYRGTEADFQYANLSTEGDWDEYKVELENQPSGLVLISNKGPKKRELIDVRVTDSISTSTQPYFVWYETDMDSIANKDLLWNIQVEMPELNTPFNGWITSVFTDSENNTLVQETIHLDRVKPNWKQGEVLSQCLMVPNVPSETTHIKLFFWNVNEEPIGFGKVRVELQELIDFEKPTQN